MNLTSMISSIAKNASDNIREEEGDYYDDGLLVCGKCHTKKQCRVNLFGSDRILFCICDCEKKRIADEERAERIRELRSYAFSGRDCSNMTLDKDDGTNEKLLTACKRYVDNFPKMRESGKGLILYGSVGTGKTFSACSIANALIYKEYRVLVSSISKIVNSMFSMSDKQEYINSLNKYSLLVLDDLGVERKSEYMQEQLYNIINGRYEAKLPMIITTNLTMDDFKNPTSTEESRIFDRILERCFPIEVSGGSHRRKNIRSDYSDMKNLLGL